jgi:hypothetical protein
VYLVGAELDLRAVGGCERGDHQRRWLRGGGGGGAGALSPIRHPRVYPSHRRAHQPLDAKSAARPTSCALVRVLLSVIYSCTLLPPSICLSSFFLVPDGSVNADFTLVGS